MSLACLSKKLFNFCSKTVLSVLLSWVYLQSRFSPSIGKTTKTPCGQGCFKHKLYIWASYFQKQHGVAIVFQVDVSKIPTICYNSICSSKVLFQRHCSFTHLEYFWLLVIRLIFVDYPLINSRTTSYFVFCRLFYAPVNVCVSRSPKWVGVTNKFSVKLGHLNVFNLRIVWVFLRWTLRINFNLHQKFRF